MVGVVMFSRNERCCSIRADFVSSYSHRAKNKPTLLISCVVPHSGAGYESSGHEFSETTDF